MFHKNIKNFQKQLIPTLYNMSQQLKTKLIQGKLDTEEQQWMIWIFNQIFDSSMQTCTGFIELLCQGITKLLTATGSKLTPNAEKEQTPKNEPLCSKEFLPAGEVASS